MTTRYGRYPVMLFSTGVYAVWFTDDLVLACQLIWPGMLLFSAGFFAAHSVASRLDRPPRKTR